MRIPLWIKLIYTTWLIVFIVHYLNDVEGYDFTRRMFWFCYVGLVLLGIGLWLESPLILSWQAVSLLIPQLVFNIDVLARLVLGRHLFPGWTDYLFDPEVELSHRILSWFHTPMPFVLLWAVWRVGYDRRALYWQIGACWVLLLLSYFFTVPDDDVNFVFGPFGEPQKTVSSGVYLVFCMVMYPLLAYLPTHLVLAAVMPCPRGRRGTVPAVGAPPPATVPAPLLDCPPVASQEK